MPDSGRRASQAAFLAVFSEGFFEMIDTAVKVGGCVFMNVGGKASAFMSKKRSGL